MPHCRGTPSAGKPPVGVIHRSVTGLPHAADRTPQALGVELTATSLEHHELGEHLIVVVGFSTGLVR